MDRLQLDNDGAIWMFLIVMIIAGVCLYMEWKENR